MKALLTSILLTTGFSAFAYQDSVSIHQQEEAEIETSVPLSMQGFGYDIRRKNIIKLNLSSLPLNTFSFQYERSIIPKISAAVGLRYTPTGRLPFSNAMKKVTVEHGSTEENFLNFYNNTTISGWAVTPEIKLFLGKGNGRGFYFAPFYRYEKLDLNAKYNYDDDGVKKSVSLAGNYKSSGVGMMMGVQFLIANRVNIDWWIVGPYYSMNSTNLNSNHDNLSATQQENLRNTLNDLALDKKLVKLNVEANVGQNQSSAKISGTSMLFRAMGITLGIKF